MAVLGNSCANDVLRMSDALKAGARSVAVKCCTTSTKVTVTCPVMPGMLSTLSSGFLLLASLDVRFLLD